MTEPELSALSDAALADLVAEAAKEASYLRVQVGQQFDCSMAECAKTSDEADTLERLLAEAAKRLRR